MGRCRYFPVVILLLLYCPSIHGSVSWFPYHYVQQANRRFEQKTDRFYEYDEHARRWVEVELPHDLVLCQDGNCRKLGLRRVEEDPGCTDGRGGEPKGNLEVALAQRKKMSLTKMSESSIWVTGESGSIYERFWNGVQWVIAPHDLPVSAGPAKSVFFVNQTILALSEAGHLYQMQLAGENSQPVWVEFPPMIDLSTSKEKDKSVPIQIKSGVVAQDATSTGQLYEFDISSRPSWKKHVRGGGNGKADNTSLMVSRGCALQGSSGDNYMSLFLLTKDGNLIERRLYQQKWKWIGHGSPMEHNLSSITLFLQDEYAENSYSLFFTTNSGNVVEYRRPKHSEMSNGYNIENWVNHKHPDQARVVNGVAGIQLQLGRLLFHLDDGRLGELHLSGVGGEISGPGQVNIRKKTSTKFIWSLLDAPETEGWNADYCTEERGPMNCIDGIKDGHIESAGLSRTVIRRRKASQLQQEYLVPGLSGSDGSEYALPDDWTNTNFRLRVMFGGKSFFLISDNGMTFEYLYAENIWFWLRHDHTTAVKGAVRNYNGSLFVVDTYGSLFMRERTGNVLSWINCTAMKKGKRVIGGPPWDGIPGRDMMFVLQDSIFLVSSSGRLLQFLVSQRQFKWKDCKKPGNMKIASIVDQEQFRANVVFVVGRNGRLYQYNKVTELWHEHAQSPHLVLSRQPGTAMRPSLASLTGSVFMISQDGVLVEYRWNAADGWNWIEHGTPNKGVTLVGSPGPCFQDSQLFLISSDGTVYRRYMDGLTWKWENLGYPIPDVLRDEARAELRQGKIERCRSEDFDAAAQGKPTTFVNSNGDCDAKVAHIRPIPFSEDSVIFELRDGRLAEMRKTEDSSWVWSRTIGTPTSSCQESSWAPLEA